MQFLKKEIALLPNLPGVYKMLDQNGKILYIGKAKNLRLRVSSYFRTSGLSDRIRLMTSLAHNIEYEVTPSEIDALILEASLVRKIMPQYNVLLKDDKSRAYIKISTSQDFPGAGWYRGIIAKKDRFFGPFGFVGSASPSKTIEQIIRLISRLFGIRPCKDVKFRMYSKIGKPCLEHQLGFCAAPCTIGLVNERISSAKYSSNIDSALDFLSGKSDNIKKNLRVEVQNLAKQDLFLQAKLARDKLYAIDYLHESIKSIDFKRFDDIDAIAIMQYGKKVAAEVFSIRKNYSLGGRVIFLANVDDKPLNEILAEFCYQYYTDATSLPCKIITNIIPADVENIKNVVSHISGTKVSIPKINRGNDAKLMSFVIANLSEKLSSGHEMDVKKDYILSKIAEIFALKSMPDRIEIYDNSHTSGMFFLGVMVVANKDGFVPSEYRRFNAKTSKPGDDYAMMEEVLLRRFSNSSLAMPDLVLIDGGKGQVSSTKKIFQKLNINVPFVGISKGPNRNAGDETFVFPDGREIKIADKSVLYHLQNLRDEAHRFAITSHRKKRDAIAH